MQLAGEFAPAALRGLAFGTPVLANSPTAAFTAAATIAAHANPLNGNGAGLRDQRRPAPRTHTQITASATDCLKPIVTGSTLIARG